MNVYQPLVRTMVPVWTLSMPSIVHASLVTTVTLSITMPLQLSIKYVHVLDMGQMVHNYTRVVKGLGCMTIKELG